MSKRMAYKDYTLKAKVDDPGKLEIILLELGATFKGVDHQKDTYFKTDTGKLKHRKGTIENLITHYERMDEGEIEKTIVYQYDVNPDTIQLDNLYKNPVIGIVEKTRKIYFLGIVKIHLDTTSNHLHYIEIEAIDTLNELSNEDLRRQCLSIKDNLKIKDTDLIKTGYL